MIKLIYTKETELLMRVKNKLRNTEVKHWITTFEFLDMETFKELLNKSDKGFNTFITDYNLDWTTNEMFESIYENAVSDFTWLNNIIIYDTKSGDIEYIKTKDDISRIDTIISRHYV